MEDVKKDFAVKIQEVSISDDQIDQLIAQYEPKVKLVRSFAGRYETDVIEQYYFKDEQGSWSNGREVSKIELVSNWSFGKHAITNKYAIILREYTCEAHGDPRNGVYVDFFEETLGALHRSQNTVLLHCF